MTRLLITITAHVLLMLAGCAQKPVPQAGFKSQDAVSYVQAHGVKVDMQLPQAFVGASTVVDAEAAQKAASSSHNLIASSGNTAGLAGLLVASLINTQMGSGSLQRDAEKAAVRESLPLASLLAGVPLQERLQQRFQRASQAAGIKQGIGDISARLVIEPKLMLTPDRGSFVLINQVQVQDIAGSALYRMRIEVSSQPIRRCGKQCIDDGTLDLAQVTAVLDECIEESMRVLAADLMLPAPPEAAQETLRYVLNGQRVVERGYQLANTGNYWRYRDLYGAVKSVPVPFEDALTQAQLQTVYGR
ncbi:hypothetical protein SAMN05216596_106228 [Pseudomonas congelans]|jgi:hypothetical protein|uniref:Lipoprotein n=1 Tax=Pseudomonas congelans TaxID=200452 RepID=A0A0N8R245_9PSED|nr:MULTISPECIES: hypothetical protein [Pseudomonas]KFE43399.1 hypothetical protein IV03_20670 [Pseudomonas congelans]KPW85766.1 Uncharacterized protein ALO92_04005 [Pseudomonas congelans]MBC8798823.1 hypothetical protein [Pseudomonas congelans]MBP1146636.1 hypothetical protein [Pseudomonas sp. PvP027]MCF5164969.1 hypothetical protein [Pseudomonas congelans]